MFCLPRYKRIEQFYNETEDMYSDWVISVLKNEKIDYMALSENKNITWKVIEYNDEKMEFFIFIKKSKYILG